MSILTLIVAGLAQGSLYALVALGLVLIYKTQGIVNFAHGEILMLGGFFGYTGFVILKLPYLVAFFCAVMLGGALGALIEFTTFRRMRSRHHATLAMVTVGLSVMFKGVARIPFGGDVYTFPPAFGSDPIQVGSALISPQSALTIGVALALALAMFLFFRFTTLGWQMRATQQNMTGARLVGISTNRVFSITWALAAGIGAGAGVLAGPISLLYPDMGTSFLLKGFAAAVLGGFDSIPGAIVAGFVIGVAELLIGGYISTAFQDVSGFVVIILALFLRPNGLFGRPPIQRV